MNLCKLMMVGVALVAVGLVLAPSVRAADEAKDGPVWLTSYDDAVKAAKDGNKLILVDFTGSDWCGYCIKLHNEVLTKKEFMDWAKDHVVLLELDFPHKTKQPEALAKQNKDLAEKYKVEGFPTVLLLDSTGKKLGEEVGFNPGSGAEWLKKFQDFVAKHDAGSKKADK